MKIIKLPILCPTHRSYKRLPWRMRKAKNHEMRMIVNGAVSVLAGDVKKPVQTVQVVVGGRANPEDYYVKPVLSELRHIGAVDDGTKLEISTTQNHKMIEIKFV